MSYQKVKNYAHVLIRWHSWSYTTTVPVSDNKFKNLSLYITVYSVALLLNLAS